MLPPEILELMLHDGRAFGWSFEQAWPHCVEAAALSSSEPEEWRAVLADTRDAWQRAYDGLEQRPSERAFASLGDGLQPDRNLDARRCDYCDRQVPIDRDPRARFCCDEHKRSWNYAIERGQPAAMLPAEARWKQVWRPEAARRCEHCDEPIPVERHPTDRFCSEECWRKGRAAASAASAA